MHRVLLLFLPLVLSAQIRATFDPQTAVTIGPHQQYATHVCNGATTPATITGSAVFDQAKAIFIPQLPTTMVAAREKALKAGKAGRKEKILYGLSVAVAGASALGGAQVIGNVNPESDIGKVLILAPGLIVAVATFTYDAVKKAPEENEIPDLQLEKFLPGLITIPGNYCNEYVIWGTPVR